MVLRLVLAVLAGVAVVSLATYAFLPTIFPATSLNLPYRMGQDASYAYGSCTYSRFTLQGPATVMGSFVTNGSAAFYIINGSQSFPASGGCLGVPPSVYSTGNVRQALVEANLTAGTYSAAFVFTNQSSGQTWLNITQGFVAVY